MTSSLPLARLLLVFVPHLPHFGHKMCLHRRLHSGRFHSFRTRNPAPPVFGAPPPFNASKLSLKCALDARSFQFSHAAFFVFI